MFVIGFHPGVVRFPRLGNARRLGQAMQMVEDSAGGIDSLGREAAFYGSNQVELVPVLVVLLKVCGMRVWGDQTMQGPGRWSMHSDSPVKMRL